MKELSVQFITFCDYAMISQENKFSVIGMFNELRVQQFPGGLASAFLIAMVKGQADTTYKLSMQGDLGKKNIFAPIHMDMRTGTGGASNIMINLNNIAFHEAGEYKFTLMHEKKEIGSTILKVIDMQKNLNPEPVLYKLPN